MDLAGLVADEHEAAAPEVSGAGISDGEGKAYGYGGVDGVAALFENGEACVRRIALAGDDHGVLGAGGFCGLLSGLLRGGGLGREEGGAEGDGQGGAEVCGQCGFLGSESILAGLGGKEIWRETVRYVNSLGIWVVLVSEEGIWTR